MKTQIFNSYDEFKDREDKSVNGCTQRFLDRNNLTFEQFVEMNSTNEGCWQCIGCKGCVDCKDCLRCEDCEDCVDCVDCIRCVGFIKEVGK